MTGIIVTWYEGMGMKLLFEEAHKRYEDVENM